MIPKIIHYCWLSDEPIPANLLKYIEGWKKLMPDYTFKKWDKKAFDIHSVKWVEDAYANRKWAFAADYIRAYALYTEGGFYLDSDVEMRKRLDPFLDNGFVSSLEYVPSQRSKVLDATTSDGKRKEGVDNVPGLGIQAAVIGGEKGHPFFKRLLDYYHSHDFCLADGTFNQLPAPAIYARILEDYGLRYRDVEQQFKDRVHIYPSSVFAGYATATFSSIALHMCAGSWLSGGGNIMDVVKKNILVRQIVNLLYPRSLH
jgi:mannosyltransferase OCH1-like enzyme